MADNIIVFSNLNPVKFRQVAYANPAPYNTKYFEDWNFAETIRDYEEAITHLQPWQNNDIIYLQLLSNYSPFNIQLQDCDGNVIDSFVMSYVSASTELAGLKAYQCAIALDDYPEGVYKLVLRSGSPTTLETLESEWMHIKALHKNSYLLQYSHDQNDYDVSFETGIEFRMRYHGGLSQYKPSTDRVTFIDQPRNVVQLDAKPFDNWKLFIGDGLGVPDWVIQRFNAIFCCSYILVDGKQFASEANVEPNREERYPMAGWSLDVRPAENSQSKRFVSAGGEDGPITTLVYNIQSRGFGPDTSPGSDNTIQVISID